MHKVSFFVFNDFTHDSRVLKEAVSLDYNGYDITVVAHNNKGLLQDDCLENVKVKRLSYFDRTVTKNIVMKFLVYLSYFFQAIRFGASSHILHCHDLNTLPVGVVIKTLFNRKAKVVYDAHEYETEINGLRGIRKKLLRLFERLLIKHADKVVTVSDSIANEYVRLYDIEKPALVLNTPPYQEIKKRNIFRETFGISKEQTVFLYQGGLSRGRGIEILLEAFARIEPENVIVFMGYGPLELMVKEYAQKYGNIFYHEAVQPDVLLNYTCSADFGMLFYENTCLNHYYCSPNKMFEYLMADIPVIVSNLYEMKKIVEEKAIGMVSKENSAEGVKAAITEVLKLDREVLYRNIQAVKNEYNWEEQEKILIRVYKDLQV